MKFVSATYVVAAGIITLLTSFMYDLTFAGLPYLDPSAEMLQRWAFHKSISSRLSAIGVVLIAGGLASKAYHFFQRFRKRF